MITLALCSFTHWRARAMGIPDKNRRLVVWAIGAFTLPADILLVLTFMARVGLLPVQ